MSQNEIFAFFLYKSPNDQKKTILRGLYSMYFIVLQLIISLFILSRNHDNRKKGEIPPKCDKMI